MTMTKQELHEVINRLLPEKMPFICNLDETFRSDRRSEVLSISYGVKAIPAEQKDIFKGYEEIVVVKFKNGTEKVIFVTGDSCAALYKDIGKVVYGEEW